MYQEDCEGIVKYGLTLKVIMPNGDALNTYECNKCHMKYTAYPNYVRLTETGGLCIYNCEEVGGARPEARRRCCQTCLPKEKENRLGAGQDIRQKPQKQKKNFNKKINQNMNQ